MLLAQGLRQHMRPADHMRIVALAIRRVAAVGDIDKISPGNSARSARKMLRPPTPLSKTPMGAVLGVDRQAAATGMVLNSPVAIFFCHSAGPVMCALVPPASTATVTGMSTTSNS